MNIQLHMLPGVAIERDEHGKVIRRAEPSPCPVLLTEDEAIRFLRLDEDAPLPADQQARYKKLHRLSSNLKPCKIGTSNRYPLAQLLKCVDQLTA